MPIPIRAISAILLRMKVDIESKLGSFLANHMPFTEECQVVYLLVEMRKILDHEGSGKYPMLRFYADWTVHTAKDKITAQIKSRMQSIYKEILERRSKKSFVDPDPKLLPFVSMMDLRTEIDKFLQDHSLPDDLILLTKNWPSFQALLASVLADQPINNPCPGIRTFSFKPAAPGCGIAEIEYETRPAEYDIYRVAGAF